MVHITAKQGVPRRTMGDMTLYKKDRLDTGYSINKQQSQITANQTLQPYGVIQTIIKHNYIL